MSFVAALRIQTRVFNAILLREIIILFGSSLVFGFIAIILEPVLHIGVVMLWHYLMRIQPIYGASKVLFIASGLYPLFVFIHLSSHFRSAWRVHDQQHRFPIETLLDFILAKAFLKLVVYCIVGLVLFAGIYYFITPQALPFNWRPVLEAMAAMAMLGVGVGMCNAAIEPLFPMWHAIYTPLARSLILFGGVLYVPDFLSANLRSILIWNPALHGVELFRQGFYPFFPTVVYMPRFMWGCALLSLVVGLCLNRIMRDRIEDS